jgi:hypothetical protein
MLGLKDIVGAIQNEKQKEYEKNNNKKTNPKTYNLISNGKVGVIGYVLTK